VQSIELGQVTLDEGNVNLPDNTLYIDCTASAVEKRPAVPIFQGDLITAQLVRVPQPAFSAALVAYVEANYEGDEAKNKLCATVPFPNNLDEYPRQYDEPVCLDAGSEIKRMDPRVSLRRLWQSHRRHPAKR
jgi:hypothetical protein